MNTVLLYSSITIGVIMVCISIYFYHIELLPLYIITYIGIITSIVNHSTTNEIAKWVDRFTMAFLCIVYIFYCYRMKHSTKYVTCIALCLIFITLALFITSKYLNNHNEIVSTIFHGITHLVAFLTFLYITYSLYDYHTKK